MIHFIYIYHYRPRNSNTSSTRLISKMQRSYPYNINIDLTTKGNACMYKKWGKKHYISLRATLLPPCLHGSAVTYPTEEPTRTPLAAPLLLGLGGCRGGSHLTLSVAITATHSDEQDKHVTPLVCPVDLLSFLTVLS